MQWLYRYVFKGLGLLMLFGMVTALILAVQFARSASEQAKSPTRISAPQK